MTALRWLACLVALVLVLDACSTGSEGAASSYGKRWGSGSSSTSSSSSGGDDSDAATVTLPGGDAGVQTIGDDGGPVGDDSGPVGTPPPPDPNLTAQQCGVCHTAIYTQWQQSMHSHGLTSPTVIAQTNQDVDQTFAGTSNPDPLKFCINCHAPNVAAAVPGANLPVPASTQYTDGVSCTTCHQFDGNPQKGSGAFATSYQGDGYQLGFLAPKNYEGELDSPVQNSLHVSNSTGKDFSPNPNKLCANCHEVWIDYNHDGVVEKGLDLALQTTWDEYTEYKTLGGTETCVSCHMPVVDGQTRAADGAQIPGQQSVAAPPRVIHDHSFPGVEFALDSPSQQTATEASRTALLQKAVFFNIDRDSVGFDNDGNLDFQIFIANTGTGHDIPSGFAFARQMWVEITVTDDNQNVLFTSGVVQNPGDDLCDGDSLFEFGNPMKRFFQNCRDVDQELTTFQQKLVDLADFELDGSDPFDPAGLTKAVQVGNETWLQYLHGGVVARQRTFDGTLTANIKPFQQEEFQYAVPTNGQGQGIHVAARLLWRQLAPYFMRALANAQPSTETPQIAPLIGNIETVVMATDSIDL
ncbi:MAG: multiheme c-type cytochrome [Polyangiaceae bacterium]